MVHTCPKPKYMIPANLKFGSATVSTMLVIAIMGLICWCFVLWYESKKDGFNTEKFFDLVFSSVILSCLIFFILTKIVGYMEIFQPANIFLTLDKELLFSFSVFLTSLLPIFFYSKRWKWSVFRILDIYSLAFTVLALFLLLGNFLVVGDKTYIILFVLFLGLYLFVLRYRGYRLLSGLIFSILLTFIAIAGTLFFRKGGYLLFYPILVTISVVNLYLRGKKTMAKTLIPEDLIAGLKQKLIKKERSLETEQQQLVREDPYLQPGRDTDNAENMDDAMEDVGKNITDARMGIVKSIRIQVKKALAAIKLGKYGTCEVCGKPIDKARLKVYPEATTCIDCATKASSAEEVKEEE